MSTLNNDLDALTYLADRQTFAYSPENVTGTKSGGSHSSAQEKLCSCIAVKPGENIVLADIDGSGMLQSMWFGGYNGWEFILRIYWDHQTHPSVECPLGAFFGYGFTNACTDRDDQFPTLNSAVVLAAPCRGFNCYWHMPFKKHCRITLENRSPKYERTTYYMITGVKMPVSDNCAYFHASYRQEKPVAENSEFTVIDRIAGKGHFAGMALFAGINGNNGCWVEGEVKMFIDGDQYPSVNYTGTEDYFGGSYAFGKDARAMNKYQTYSGLYTGMYAVLGGGRVENDWDSGARYNSQPRFMAYRWHIPDPIYFNTDFRMTFQNLGNFLYGQRSRKDDYASAAFWYQTLPSLPLKPLPSNEELDMQ